MNDGIKLKCKNRLIEGATSTLIVKFHEAGPVRFIISKMNVESFLIFNTSTYNVKTKCRDQIRSKGQEILTLVYIFCNNDSREVMILVLNNR